MPVLSRSIAILALIGLATSCDARENGLGPGTANPDRTAPSVVSTLPTTGTTQVSRTGPISVTFSEPMSTASMIAANLTFSPAATGTLSYTGNTATFVPSPQFAAGQTYTVTVTTAAEDRAGNNLPAPFVFSFSTDPTVIVASR